MEIHGNIEMSVSFIFVFNLAGEKLFNHFYNQELVPAVIQSSLLTHYSPYFRRAVFNRTCVTIFNIQTVMSRIGDFFVVVGGRGSFDEIILSEISDTIASIFHSTLDGKMTETNLLEADNYGKIAVAIDEVISNVSIPFYQFKIYLNNFITNSCDHVK